MGQIVVKSWDTWIGHLETKVTELENSETATAEEINAAKAKLDKAKNQQKKATKKALEDVVKNRDNISEE